MGRNDGIVSFSKLVFNQTELSSLDKQANRDEAQTCSLIYNRSRNDMKNVRDSREVTA
jgi:hypothetical protein